VTKDKGAASLRRTMGKDHADCDRRPVAGRRGAFRWHQGSTFSDRPSSTRDIPTPVSVRRSPPPESMNATRWPRRSSPASVGVSLRLETKNKTCPSGCGKAAVIIVAYVSKDGMSSFGWRAKQDDVLSPRVMIALTESHLRLFKQIELVNRVWCDRIDATRRSEMELGARLLKCTDPGDAVALCHEWMSKHVADFIADNQRIATLWLEFAHSSVNRAKDSE
jgi:hypothetical protein